MPNYAEYLRTLADNLPHDLDDPEAVASDQRRLNLAADHIDIQEQGAEELRQQLAGEKNAHYETLRILAAAYLGRQHWGTAARDLLAAAGADPPTRQGVARWLVEARAG